MSVRWKPLLILSGLFLAVALVGVIAISGTLVPPSSQGFLKRARAAREAKRFEPAEIDYKQVLQIDTKSAAIHEEFAEMYREWAATAPDAKKASLRAERLKNLLSAVKIDKAAKGPRRELLNDAMDEDLEADSIRCANDVLSVDPENTDAHFVLAAVALEERTPNISEARRHQKVIEAKPTPEIRKLWIRAKLANASGDLAARTEAFSQAQKIVLKADCAPVDRITWMRIAGLEIRTENDPARRDSLVRSMLEQAKELCQIQPLALARVSKVRTLLEQTQQSLIDRSSRLAGADVKANDGLVEAIEVEIEAIFQLALSGVSEPELQTYLAYANHLRFRRQRDRCLEVVEKALKLPQAARRDASHAVMGLLTVAIEMALVQSEDPGRFDKAAPHIKALIESPLPRAQGLGHLFAGSIDLDQSGLARELASDGSQTSAKPPGQFKLRNSALNHLKIAAAQLPDIAEAQARFGVALVLAGEQNQGRQFLQTALRLGSLDVQYQLVAAWTILQAGYPEEAEPIVERLMQELSAGTTPKELAGSIHLLRGEVYQSRRTADDLIRAAAEFDRALAAGHEPSAAVVIRLAQIDVQLGRHDKALKRIDALKAQGKGTPAIEQLAVLSLVEQGKKPDARLRLKAARQQFPQAAELAGLEAALLAKDGKPAEADAVLANFLKAQPDNATLVMMRAQIQAESMNNDEKARVLLEDAATRSETSAPLVQLADLELKRNRLDAAATVIAKIRSRWKEAATSDVLEAQLALKRGQTALAIEHFDAALKKDPDNKIVQYWKAQLDGQNGSVVEATKSLEAIVRDKPIKEIDSGMTLLSAAQSALANLSLRTGALDDAIRRFEELKRGDQNGTLSKDDRWQLITAYVARGQWPTAKREIAALLNDAANAPTDDERVRGANYYRQQGEDKAAEAQLDYVLKVNPTHTAAVVTGSYIRLKAKEYDKAAAILKKGMEMAAAKDKVPVIFHLMLAAIEIERPGPNARDRAIAILDQGLEKTPDAVELVQAKYTALKTAGQAGPAVAFVEAKAKEFPKGPFRRELVSIYRDLRDYERAAALLRELMVEFPDDANLAAALVQIVSFQAFDARTRNQPDLERELNLKAATMLKEFRSRFEKNLVLLQAECDLVQRRGDFARAVELTREIDNISKTSALGPLLRARLYATLGKTREIADAYKEALERNPRQLDVRLLLGQTSLLLHEPDEALRQAGFVLAAEKNRPDAVLLEARALAQAGTKESERQANQAAAIERLEGAIKANPQFGEAYRTLAEIHTQRNDRAAAANVLKQELKANPQDATAAARLVEMLSRPDPSTHKLEPADLEDAKRVAEEIAARDQKGTMILAVAIGFNRVRRLDLALSYAEAAAAKLGTPTAHLNLGDVLLSVAESEPDQNKARATFTRAIAEYDLVLQAQPNSVEAVNNKAWILHTYLDKTQQALDLAIGLQKRVNPNALPGEFYDTLGAIQEAVGQTRNAEQAYLDGLKKSPDHPMLNFHYGKMIATDRSRAGRARTHLKKAVDSSDRINPEMAREAVRLLRVLESETGGRAPT
jgi:cellulose synthase operon protein C